MPNRHQSAFYARRILATLVSAASIIFANCAESQEPQAASSAVATIPTVHLEPAFSALTFSRPVFITQAPDDTNRMFVVEQTGRIMVFENRDDVTTATVFLDIKDRVRNRHNEEGLLSLAFHPKFKDNGRFFVYHTAADPKRNRISQYTVSRSDPTVADPASELIILEQAQKYGNHNGSTLLFGPDGMLYASFGDGGLANDPDGNGQNLGVLLGKIIRIDVDHQSDGKNYAIPADNPFVTREGARPEIWAFGLRNVWRMSFDRDSGTLWAGDVGQNKWEEVDIITKGGNYGWKIREGLHEFAGGPPTIEPVIEPVFEYPHRDGISITGGYVYRGKSQPKLQGVYVVADYASRTIWGLRGEAGKPATSAVMLKGGTESAFITSFGEDRQGELFACALDKMDGGPGRVFRVKAD